MGTADSGARSCEGHHFQTIPAAIVVLRKTGELRIPAKGESLEEYLNTLRL